MSRLSIGQVRMVEVIREGFSSGMSGGGGEVYIRRVHGGSSGWGERKHMAV